MLKMANCEKFLNKMKKLFYQHKNFILIKLKKHFNII